MNAVLIRAADAQDRYPVKYAGGNQMNESLSELPADVRNLQIHVTDIKAEVRATNLKIDSLREKIEEHRAEDNKKIEARFDKIDAKFEKVEQNRVEDNRRIDDRFKRVDDRFEEARKETKAEFAAVRAEMQAGFKEVRANIDKLGVRLDSEKNWALGLYLAGTGAILGLMAHGFKWI